MMASIREVPDLLRERGYWVNADENWWDHDNPGTFHPVGIMVHHTAMTRPLSLEEARKNRRLSDGAICNVIIRQTGEMVFVTGGYAYDSGTGFKQVVDWIRDGHAVLPDAKSMTYIGEVNGNPWFYDIEVDHPGDGSPLPQPAQNALVGLCWAISLVNGWSANVIIGHRTWTDRKVDPRWSGLSLQRLREQVGQLLIGSVPIDSQPPPEPGPMPSEPTPSGSVPLLGGDISPLAMQDWARSKGASDLFVSLAAPARSISLEYGVNPRIPYGVMLLETGKGWFTRTGQPDGEPGVLDPSFHNWGGIKTSQGGGNSDASAHMRFTSHLTGVKAVVQHVAAYAGVELPDEAIVDPRYKIVRGLGARIASLPSAEWGWSSTGLVHSQKVAQYANEMSG